MSATATAALFGLDSTFAPAVFGLLGSLVGAGAAIGGQWLSQAATNKRDRDARVRRELRVRQLFGARVRSLASSIAILISVGWPTLQKVSFLAKDSLETLLRDFDNDDLLLSLEPEIIQGLGYSLPAIQKVLSLLDQDFLVYQARGDGVPLEEREKRQLGDAFDSIFADANMLLRLLGGEQFERPKSPDEQ